MRIHRISLRDYKGIRSAKIEPREQGVTIIEGENEAGKSSIAEAIWLIFEQVDDSSSQLVKGLKPVDRDAATEIEIEVSTGQYRFTYFKRFHRGSRTELTITQPRRESLSGREAHVRARQILDETIDRALWEALRLQQGANLDPIAPGQHTSLLSALDLAAGEASGGDREETLFERIEQEYERYFTATGKEKGSGDGPNAPRLRAALDARDAEVTRLATRITMLEERSNQAAEFEARSSVLSLEVDRVRTTITGLLANEAARREQQHTVETFAADLRAHEAGLRAATMARDARAQEAAAIGPRKEEQQRLAARFEALAGPLAQAGESREQATTACTTAEASLAGAERAREAAERHLQLASAEFTAQTMAERLERLESKGPEIEALTAWLGACTIDRAVVGRIEQAQQRVDRLNARRDADGASVEVSSAAALDFQINGKTARIEPGQTRRGTVLGDSTIELPGGIRITIRAGAVAREIAAEATSAEEALAAAVASSGVESLEAARAVLEERLVTEERLRGLREQLKADLRDLASAEELRQKLGRERARIAALRHDSDAVALSIDAAKAALDAAGRAMSEAELEARAARATVAQAEKAFASLENERQQLENRIAELHDETARMEAALAAHRTEQPDEDIEQQCRRHGELRNEAHAALAEASERLAAAPDRSDALATAQHAIRTLESESSDLGERRAGLLALLEDAGAEGLHGQLVEAEQRRTTAETELAAYVRRAAAARTLYETMKAARDRARANYEAPLRTNIETLGRRVFGDSFSVELAPELRIARVARGGMSLELSQLSVGAREQLAVLTRLACAQLVSAAGGAPVVLDDILGWTDPARLRTLGPILAATAAESQVLLFTCTPERFATVAPARVVRLPSCEVVERESPGIETPATSDRGDLAARRAAAAPPKPLLPQATFDLFAEPEPAGAAQN